MNDPGAFWSEDCDAACLRLDTSHAGLSSVEAARRRALLAGDALPAARRHGLARVVLRQLGSPILLLLVFAATLSFVFAERTDAAIIVGILAASVVVGAWQESGAERAVEALLETVRAKCRVLRDGVELELPPDELVPGDVVVLSAGSLVPADCRLLDAHDLFCVEAALTGESFPVEKHHAPLAPDTPLPGRANSVFLGTHVASGAARALVVAVGRRTALGDISARLARAAPEPEFEHGLFRFGLLLVEVTLALTMLIFAANVALARPVLDSLLFSLALAIGLAPQLLPAILALCLARGARAMAQRRVIVKRLSAIENLGSMDVLCSDKTGTLTEGIVRLEAACDPFGGESARVLALARLNAAFATSFSNPLDDALCTGVPAPDPAAKLDEVPWDFVRKRESVLVRLDGRNLLVTKGPIPKVLEVATELERPDGGREPIAAHREAIEARFRALSERGARALAVAVRDLGAQTRAERGDERDLVFIGLLVFADRLKEDSAAVVASLRELGVELKILTGDNRWVASHVARQVGLKEPRVLTGEELRELTADALAARAVQADVIAEVEPAQKERVILALKRAGRVAGFLGDGINDAGALHVADVGISVDSATDVAKEAAEIVLLDRELSALRDGILEGRRTFANTQKYVFMATSSNFGNMLSVAAASLFIPFLPMLPKQILLLNFLGDLAQLTIAGDRVEDETLAAPRRWNVRFIRRFMLLFGAQSSVFDLCCFALLLLALKADATLFRSGWFVESVLSEVSVVFALRTALPLGRSRPSRALVASSVAVGAIALALPYSPLAGPLGFAPLPPALLGAMLGLVALYFASAEALKRLVGASAG
ncbi:MAG TPA: magnesium-translocating P-type ATPase [Myxococcota bacterium]|nr:magnesium-translocating P-type ATPase [Myxococcota bacterium]